MKRISDAEATRRIQAWADVTMLSLDLKRAALKQKYPRADERELSEMIREENETRFLHLHGLPVHR